MAWENYYRAERTGAVLPPRILGVQGVNGTNVLLSLSGVSGQAYRVEFTPTLSLPVWQTLATNTAGAGGLFQFTDTNGLGETQRFYRLVWP